MVRVFIKGGVWKNSEDEILKAAVMKYGKQQWARVASLLNRKSAKQCKARWNEWLDPSVRKVEWSRDEEEKLLHLAKLLPSQWRTIGPIVGRTAAQCQEKYERLLDEAAAANAALETEGGVGGGVGVAGGSAASAALASATLASSARRLRPGEIDPHPETKPARPDPIDMDEDEIEMLQEARARLANTLGKKAKRKQRERMLAEAKRLADLQKRRELKQAGLMSSLARTKVRGGAKKRRQEIDLGVEIPFYKPAPAGFHSIADEKHTTDVIRAKRLKDVNYQKLNEANAKSRDRDAINAQKKEQARIRSLERANMQLVVKEVSKTNDPLAHRPRGVLRMPTPLVSDGELEAVAKLNKNLGDHSLREEMERKQGTGGPTDALMGDYSDRPLPTPMRTPASASSGTRSDVVLREASNLRLMEQGQTPLLGEANPILHAKGAASNATPRMDATPSVMTMRLGGASATPLTRAGNATPSSTRRDELGLNQPQWESQSRGGEFSETASVTSTLATKSVRELAREERRAAKLARQELEAALAALPAPQFDYELAVPVMADEDEGELTSAHRGTSALERDAADVEQEELQKLQDEAAKLYASQSSVVKRRDLPRPANIVGVPAEYYNMSVEPTPASYQQAEKLLLDEVVQLTKHDAHAHPVPHDNGILSVLDLTSEQPSSSSTTEKGKKSKKKSKKRKLSTQSIPLDFLPEDSLLAARTLLEDATRDILQEQRLLLRNSLSDPESISEQELDDALTAQNVASSRTGATTTNTQTPTELATLTQATSLLTKRATKLQSKLAVQLGGYSTKASAISTELLQHYAEYRHVCIEEEVFNHMFQREKRVIPQRIQRLQEEVTVLEVRERVGQKKYGDLMLERNRRKVLELKQSREAVKTVGKDGAGAGAVVGKTH